MAWTANLLRKEDHGAFIDFIVEFTDGVTFFEEQFRTHGGESTDNIRSKVVTRLLQCENLSTIDIALGTGDLTPAAPSIPTPPTAEELVFRAWLEKYRKLQRAEDLVTAQVIPTTHTTVVALRSEVATEFQDSFLANLGIT